MSTAYAVESSIKRRRPTMKKTWKQKFRDWLYKDENELVAVSPLSVDHNLDSSESLRFSIYRASGGLVIETRTYDRRKDQNNTQLHIITDEKNLGNELAKIITLEALRG